VYCCSPETYIPHNVPLRILHILAAMHLLLNPSLLPQPSTHSPCPTPCSAAALRPVSCSSWTSPCAAGCMQRTAGAAHCSALTSRHASRTGRCWTSWWVAVLVGHMRVCVWGGHKRGQRVQQSTACCTNDCMSASPRCNCHASPCLLLPTLPLATHSLAPLTPSGAVLCACM
jgi:hypothetical protein